MASGKLTVVPGFDLTEGFFCQFKRFEKTASGLLGFDDAVPLFEDPVMATKIECDQFAAEFNRRFEALIEWAGQQWPEKNQPLSPEEFVASRREIALLLGARLHAQPPADSGPAPSDGGEQYVNVAPAPWP